MRKSGLTGDEAYVLSKHGKTTEDLGPLKKEIGLMKEDLSNKITKFYASNQGEAHLADSDNGKIMDMMVYGKSSQDGTPSLENPVEIKSVVEPEIKITGKNLLPFLYKNGSKTENGVTFDVQNDGTIHIYGTASATTYFNFSTNIEWGSDSFSNTNEKYKLVGSLFYNAGNKTLSYVVNEGATYDFILKPMVVLNTETDLTYEPYHEQTVTLLYTLNAIPVSSDGNVTIDGQQYVADYVDVERGKLVRMCKEKVFDGTEKWRSELSYMVADIPNFSYVDNNNHEHMTYLLCNKYKVSKTIGDNDNLIFIRINGDGVVIKDTLHQSTVDDWKKYLNDNPCIVHCLSAIPEEISLTTEEIIAFKALATYYPTTNISVNSEQLDGYTVFNYPISMANGWNHVKQQLNDNRDYIYDMDLQSAEAYVNSEYAVALTELEV